MKKGKKSKQPQTLQMKQNYLLKQIIEQNIDPQQFQEYMANQNGLDLQNYTMKQLIKLVKQFKGSFLQSFTSQDDEIKQNQNSIIQVQQKNHQQFKEQRKNQKLQKNQNHTILSKKNNDQEQKNKQYIKDQQKPDSNDLLSFLRKQQLKQSQNYQYQSNKQSIIQKTVSFSSINSFNSINRSYILAKKQSISQLYKQIHQSHKEFCVYVRSFSKKQSNSILFKYPYISYHISCSNGWKVERRFNDFNWLYKYFKQMYHGLPIPPIPSKTTMRSFDDFHIEQRMILFERFLKKCLDIPQICSDPVLQSFLSIQSQQQFQFVKQKHQNKLKNKQNVFTYLKGQQILKYGSNSIPASKIQFYNQSIYKTALLNDQLKQLSKNLKIASVRAINATNIFKELTDLNKKSQINCSSLFDAMGQFVNQISYKLDNQYYYLKNYIQNVWSYEQKYQQNLVQNIQTLQKHKLFLKNKSKIVSNNKQCQELLMNENFQSYNLDNKYLSQYLKSKQLYQIEYSLLSEQIERHQHKDLLKISKQWSEGIKKYMEQLKDGMLIGVDMYTRSLCISQGKDLMEVQYISTINKKDKNNLKIVQEVKVE